jgi:hypothetical protein
MTLATSEGMSKLVGFIANILLVVVLAWAGFLQTQLSKMDERIYSLQKDSVTEQKMNAMEQRIMQYTDVRLGDISSKMEVQNKYLEMVFQNTKK